MLLTYYVPYIMCIHDDILIYTLMLDVLFIAITVVLSQMTAELFYP